MDHGIVLFKIGRMKSRDGRNEPDRLFLSSGMGAHL
jgi:hypothetical protein